MILKNSVIKKNTDPFPDCMLHSSFQDVKNACWMGGGGGGVDLHHPSHPPA